MEEKTTIQISHKSWAILNKQKKVGENFNDVLERILNSQATKTKKELNPSQEGDAFNSK